MSHRPTKDWQRQGCPKPIPAYVQEHLQSCQECAAEQAKLAEEKAWFASEAKPQNAFAMRQAVLAAVDGKESKSSSRPLWAALVFAGACVLLLASLSLFDLESSATMVPLSAAKLEVLQIGPEEKVALHDGSVRFDVPKRKAGERFVVAVGESLVEVVGTSFVVEAREDRLISVRVSEGIVVVKHDGQTHRLKASEHFTAPKKALAKEKLALLPEPKSTKEWAPSLAPEPVLNIAKESPPKAPPKVRVAKSAQFNDAELTDAESEERERFVDAENEERERFVDAEDEERETFVDAENEERETFVDAESQHTPTFAEAWAALQVGDDAKAMAAFEAMDFGEMGSLEATARYWEIVVLLRNHQKAQAQKRLAILEEAFPQNHATLAAIKLIREK